MMFNKTILKPKRRKGRPRGTTGQAPVLTDQQVRQIFRVAESRKRCASRAKVAFGLSVALGLRAKELALLTWGDVLTPDDQLREVLHLKRAYTKGSRTRDVYLSSPKIRQMLSSYCAECAPVFGKTHLFESQKGRGLRPSSMARLLKDLYRDAGIPDGSSHSGRRTLITRLAEKGIDLKAISTIAGHSNIRTTAIYVETNPTRLSRILQDVRW